MFGLDLSFVILVPERKRGIDTGIQENFDSLFDLDIRVKPEYDRKGNRLRLGHENDRKFFCKPRNCRGKTRHIFEPPAAHTASPFNSLLSFPNTTQKPRFYTLKEEQKSPFYSPFNLLSFLSVSICFGKLYKDFLHAPLKSL